MFESFLIINGRSVGSPEGVTYERRDPMSDAVVTRASAGCVEDALAAADAAAAAFPSWSSTRPDERAALLHEAARLFEARGDEVVAIAANEIGSSEAWIRFNIEIACQILRQAAELAALVGEEHPDVAPEGCDYILRRRPAGVVLGLAPWNAAVTLGARAVAAPLACGNTVVLKGSELCPKTHEWVARAFCDAGLPAGVLNFITNAPEKASEVVEALIAHPSVRRVNFTGSTRVGREIAVVAARHLKRCLLELSGKGTMLILEDADLDEAARAAAHGAFFNMGQICMSTERIVVEEAVADAFLEKFLNVTRAMWEKSGNGAPLGHLISAQAALRLRGLIDDAVAKGAQLLTGGEVFNTTMQPAILDHVSPGMRLYSEECFGPVAGVIRVADAEEGLSVANDTEFGLACSVFSADAERATELLRNIECGIGHVNGSTVYDDPQMPFGGVKDSGYGRFGGQAALEEFTEIQWLTVRKDRQTYIT
ncbi:MAG: aldehyde dehydrogenase [Rhodobacteraceae bacterium]|nr:aldehyde dehydrogenase [Paracoccaceae bacterium]